MEEIITRFVVVIVAYNRPKPLERLLNSIRLADYDYANPKIIISIDKSDSCEVFNTAMQFKKDFINVEIIQHKENLGLRKHILACGDLVIDYDALIMLEDDIIVSTEFFKYSYEAVQKYSEDERIAGISLYNYNIAEFSNLRPFFPLHDGYDNYFMQIPSSQGQIWTKTQWLGFKEWYENHEWDQSPEINLYVPSAVNKWKETSWKKYFYYYIVCFNKYIVYPRIGLSSNMGESGIHVKKKHFHFQCELLHRSNRRYIFSSLSESMSIYDAFFENIFIKQYMDEIRFDVPLCTCYYERKQPNSNDKYLLSVKLLDYQIIKSWALDLIPYELNIIYNLKGEGLYLFDLSKPIKRKGIEKWKQQIRLIKYDNRGLSDRKAAYVFLNYILTKLKIIR